MVSIMNADKALSITQSSGIYCGALSYIRSEIEKGITLAASNGKRSFHMINDELHKGESELSVMIISEIKELGYTFNYINNGIVIRW